MREFLDLEYADKSTQEEVEAGRLSPTALNTAFVGRGTESGTLGADIATGTGWSLGTGWTGDFATGFVHTTGNTAALTSADVAAGRWLVTFTSSTAITAACPAACPSDIQIGSRRKAQKPTCDDDAATGTSRLLVFSGTITPDGIAGNWYQGSPLPLRQIPPGWPPAPWGWPPEQR